MRTFRKLITVATGAAVLAGGSLFATPGAALADPQEAIGYQTSPGQGYAERPVRAYDWLGSYLVNDKQVWCVQYALTAPDSGEEYEPGDELRTKWGTPLSPEVGSNISYLLLRYGDTQSKDEAAALAHLLHSWTAPPRTPSDVSPDKSFKDIAYAIKFQFEKLPKGAKEAVGELRKEAKANHGPWKASLTAPEGQQTIGQSAEWTLAVTRPDSGGVGDVPVKLTVSDAKVEGLSEDGTVTTPADGSPLKLKVTPTGPNPKVTGALSAPADKPYVQSAVHQPDTTQRVVSTGGEKQLKVKATATAVTAPGAVAIGKIDAESKAGIAGVALRVTGPDKSTPARRQDGTPLVGPDGKPAVVTTRQDGTASVPDLRTPQEVCVLETAPAKGYEQAFDPTKPPTTCGMLKAGQTLSLKLTNKANTPTVPVRIPAGNPGPLAGETVDLPFSPAGGDGGVPAGLLGLGALTLTGAAVGCGFALRRRAGGSKQ